MSTETISLSRFLRRQPGRADPGRDALSSLVLEMATAAKITGREVRRAALLGRLGLVGETNPSGDAQKKLDVYANQVVVDTFIDSDLVAGIVSEEMEELRVFTCRQNASYLICVDPLDGSSNTDVNGPLGSIFSFHRRTNPGRCEDGEVELREASQIVAAGYVLYGPSTVFVYSLGDGVHGFTLDHDVGEFLLSHETIRCPSQGRYFSANFGRYGLWEPALQRYADHLIAADRGIPQPYSLRYGGALVADLHRNLLEGGIYFYPGDRDHPDGKLRLLYECAPLAYVVEQAGGKASTGRERILDLRPRSLHQTVPFVVGGRGDVESFESFLKSSAS